MKVVNLLTTALVVFGTASCRSVRHTRASAPSTWTMVWDDEFDEGSLDATKWTVVEKAGAIACYTARPENVSVSGGNLILTALHDNYVDPRGVSHPYTSGYIQSQYKGDWTYGAFEIRAKLAPGNGMHSAIWMLPTDNLYGPWPNSGEIDIMEADGASINTVHGDLVWTGGPNLYSMSVCTLPSGDFSQDFHVFRAEWEPGQISWYVDAKRYVTQTKWSAAGYPFPAPFNRRFYLILNLSILGAKETLQDSTTVFPNATTIDYVRVYQEK